MDAPRAPLPVLDPEALRRLRKLEADAEPGLVSRIAGTFLEQLPALLEGVRRAIAAGDAEGAARLAHSLRGRSATLGARRLSASAGALETETRAGGGAGGALLAALEAEAALAAESLRRELFPPADVRP